MSLINDALKQARKDMPTGPNDGPPPLQPVQAPPSGTPAWLWPVLVILLVVAAVCFIGWAATHRNESPVATQQTAPPTSQTAPAASVTLTVAPVAQPEPIPMPASNAAPAVVAPASTNGLQPAVNTPFVLKLQGIDYSAKTASAILNGKTVRTGDVFHEYRVKAILQDSVILIGPDNKPVQLGI